MDGAIVLIALAAMAFLILSGMGQAASDSTNQDSGTGSAPAPADNNSSTGGTDNVPDPGSSDVSALHITNDPITWPTGDRVWDVCRAIAMAEGANIAGSVPDRYNNPGDISDGASEFSQTYAGSMITEFPDKATGWSWLYSKVFNAASGQSTVYLPSMTWIQIAQKWAGNWQAWVTNVCNQLGVTQDSTLNDYVGFQQVTL